MESPDFETKIHFPPMFLLGAASSAHQVEGNNCNSDWWQAEQQGKVPKSGIAADHYNRYNEDFQIAHDIGLNAMRISIEWARIEPVAGRWDPVAIEHYKKVLKTMKEQGLIRMVTLWHWTLPAWLAEKGGFETKEGVEAFARFAWFVAQNLGSEIDLWITLNEPETYCSQAYSWGNYPPFKKNLILYLRVLENLILAHKKGYATIKSAWPEAKIGLTKNLTYYQPFRKNNLADRIISFVSNRIGNYYFLEKIQKESDFIGLNYYFYNRVKFEWRYGHKDMNFNFGRGQLTLDDGLTRSDMGWVLYPEGIYHLLLDLKKYKKPIYITENGLADSIDSRRPKYLREVLGWVSKSMAQGVDVRGYFHWALTDNYEWRSGFGPRFGLVEIDYTNQKRTIRPSAQIFKEINR